MEVITVMCPYCAGGIARIKYSRPEEAYRGVN